MEGIKLILPIIIDSLNPNDNYNPFPSVDAKYGPYTDLATARSVLANYKVKGLTIGIIENNKIVEYWIEEDGGDFVKKQSIIDNIAAEKVTYSIDGHTDITNAKDAFDKLFNKVYWTELALSSFTMSPDTTTLEVGNSEEKTFTWSWNKTPKKQTINNNEVTSGHKETVTSTTPKTISYTLQGFDNYAEGGEYNVTSTKSVTFKYKMFIYEGDISTIDTSTAKYSKWCETQTIGDGSATVLTGNIISICVPYNKTVQFTNDNTGEVMSISQKVIENSTDNTINYTCGSTTTKYKIMQIKVDRTLITTKVTIKIS